MKTMKQTEEYNLPDRVYRDIISFAKSNDIERIVLYGSRARGTNHERSDIDLAVSGGNTQGFYWDIHEKAHTLLMFDIVNMDEIVSEDFKKEIERDGVILYEKG